MLKNVFILAPCGRGSVSEILVLSHMQSRDQRERSSRRVFQQPASVLSQKSSEKFGQFVGQPPRLRRALSPPHAMLHRTVRRPARPPQATGLPHRVSRVSGAGCLACGRLSVGSPPTHDALTMATTFHFRAVAADGKPRTGTVTAENDKLVAKELRRQGLIPVYIGLEKASKGLRASAPHPSPRQTPRHSLLHPGTLHAPQRRRPSRPRPLHHRRAHHARRLPFPGARRHAPAQRRQIAGRQPRRAPLALLRALRQHGPSRRSLRCALGPIFERLSEFERTRDELRGYITSSLIYPALLSVVGLGSILVLLNFVVPRFAQIFSDPRMKIPTPTLLMITRQRDSYRPTESPLLIALAVGIAALRVYIGTALRPLLVGRLPPEGSPCWAMRCARPKPPASPGPWVPW